MAGAGAELRALALSAAAAAVLIVTARRRHKSSSSKKITIIGLGSLLSERSARTTFPTLSNFRLGRLAGHRRVFAHSPAIFVQRKIADVPGKQMASLSAEPCEGSSFIVTAFEVPDSGEGMEAFREREEEFALKMVPFTTLDGKAAGEGMLCLASSDQAYIAQWGQRRFDELYTANGLHTIWGWPRDSGLRPCATYLRHCALAAAKLGPEAHASFVEETYLVDRVTTVRAYLERHPHVMSELPEDPVLRERYAG